MKPLVAYYSRTGTTRRVAEKLADLLKCVGEELHDTTNRAGIGGWIRAGRDSGSKKLTVLEKVKNDPLVYDITIIGTPIWNHTLSTPVRTYCTEYKDRFKRVAFFCTGDSDDDDPFDEMEAICGKKAVATLRLHRKQEVDTGQYVKKVEEFANNILA